MSADVIKLPDRAPKQASAAVPTDKEARCVAHLLREAESLNELLIELEHLLPDDGAGQALRTTRQSVVAMIERARQALDKLDEKAVP